MEKIVLDITESIYQNFGSGTGYLFGIPPKQRSSVEAIVKAVLMHSEINKI
jgi:hypothetical protein